MKPKKLNTTLLWKQFEDFLYPQLGFSITDRAVYHHLIRHSRLDGNFAKVPDYLRRPGQGVNDPIVFPSHRRERCAVVQQSQYRGHKIRSSKNAMSEGA